MTGYILLMAYLVLVKLVILGAPDLFRSTAQAAVFSWPFLAVLAAVGPVGLWLARRCGLPGFWDTTRPLGRRLGRPAAWGAGLGVVAIAFEAATRWSEAAAAELGLPSIHIAFPASLLIYPGGAIIVDVVYYLVPIPVLVWLVGHVILRGRHRTVVFWAVGALAAAIEPVTQDLGGSAPAGIAAGLFASDYALNLAQVAFFRSSGFFAAVVLRVVFYLLWHVIWGALAS